jgi:UDP-glucose 4-epimerase
MKIPPSIISVCAHYIGYSAQEQLRISCLCGTINAKGRASMNILVTGGAGFIGSNLCRVLVSKDHMVVCADDLSLGTMENIDDISGNFQFVQADVNDDSALDYIFARRTIDYVMHLAANSDIKASAENPFIEYKNTYSTTFHVLEAMRRHGVKRLFFASTSAVYGDRRDEALAEDAGNLSPVSYYGAAKLGSEALISAYAHMNEMSALVLRFPNVLGPGLTHGALFDFMNRLEKDPERLLILGDGSQTKPYLHVNDLIDAILLLTDVSSGIHVYNAGVETATSVKTIADIACEEMGLSNAAYDYTGGEIGWKGDVPRFAYDLGKIHAAGWQAKLSSDEAVRQTAREEVLRRGRTNGL